MQIGKVQSVLEALNIEYEIKHHERVSAMEELDRIGITQGCDYGKNLFVHNRSKKAHYLITLSPNKHADLKSLARAIGSSRLEFAGEGELMRYLGVIPGSVSLAGVTNNKEHDVIVVIDKDLRNSDRFAMHPNDNTATVFLKMEDVVKLIHSYGNELIFADI